MHCNLINCWLSGRPTVIVGLFLQQAIALFVLKTSAGFSIFTWIATLASDFLNQSKAGATFFFDAETISKGWFFVNTVKLMNTVDNFFHSSKLFSLLRLSFLLLSFKWCITSEWCNGCLRNCSLVFAPALNTSQTYLFSLKRLVLLQTFECIWCWSCCRCILALDRTRRICMSCSSLCWSCASSVLFRFYKPDITLAFIVMTESEIRMSMFNSCAGIFLISLQRSHHDLRFLAFF